MATPQPAFARDGGAVAAGVIGGLAVGAIIGSQVDRGDYGGPGYIVGLSTSLSRMPYRAASRLKTGMETCYAARSRLRLTFSSA